MSPSDQEASEELGDSTVQPRFETAHIEGKDMHYVYTDRDKEALIVFVHGSPGSWSAFIDFFRNDTLLERCDILSIDRPGFGASNRGIPEPRMQDQSRLLQKVVGLFDHERVTRRALSWRPCDRENGYGLSCSARWVGVCGTLY